MALGLATTALLGGLAFWWGLRIGRVLSRQGATANDLFQGNNSLALLFLGLYVGLIALALYLPQLQSLPLEIRFYGLQISWIVIRVLLLALCGVLAMISWKTARLQVVVVITLGLLGLSGFNAAEAYFLSPIYPSLMDNLRPNGVFQQTSTSSCAPSALATVLRLWGLNATESEVARLAETSRMGTTMPQLIVAARELGMDGLELESATWEQMLRINRPGVLATWLFDERGRQAHAVALLKLDPFYATIGDPAFGRIYQVPRAQFNRIWRRQYVPIFRPTDVFLAPSEAAEYLHQRGYLTSLSGDLTVAIRQFQQDMGVSVTGTLDTATVLLLSGSVLSDGPRLDDQR